MIDFNVRNRKIGGLTIGFYPGIYRTGAVSRDRVFVAEEAYFFLEPSVKLCSQKYARPYAHWGVTPITKQEWNEIIAEWQRLRDDMTVAAAIEQVSGLSALSQTLKSEFNSSFEEHQRAFTNFVDELSSWIQQELRNDEFVSILGV